jgi:hypothetical protein
LWRGFLAGLSRFGGSSLAVSLTAVVGAFYGVVIVVGWFLGNPLMLDPMQVHVTAAFTGGIGLLLGSGMLYASAWRFRMAETICALLLLLLASGTTFAYAFKTGFFLDWHPPSSFLESYATHYRARMAPDAAISLVLLAVAHLQRRDGGVWRIVCRVAASFVALLSGGIILGYVAGRPNWGEWIGSQPRMALLVALGVFTLACGLWIRLLSESPTSHPTQENRA